MATILSNLLTNTIANNVELNVSGNRRSNHDRDSIALTTGNLALNNVIALGFIKANDILASINVVNSAALDSNGTPTLTVDFGLYTMSDTGALTVVNATVFGSGNTQLRAANATTPASVYTPTAANYAKRVQDLISDTSPKTYVIGMKISAAAATAGAAQFAFQITKFEVR